MHHILLLLSLSLDLSVPCPVEKTAGFGRDFHWTHLISQDGQAFADEPTTTLPLPALLSILFAVVVAIG